MSKRYEKNATIAANWVKRGFTVVMINRVVKRTMRDGGWVYVGEWCITTADGGWAGIDVRKFCSELGFEFNDMYRFGQNLTKAGIKIFDHGEWIIFIGKDFPKDE